MQRAISTQEELTAFKSALEVLARNLAFHVYSALGKAHGIELFMGYIDAYGNDLRVYYDSKGIPISGTNTSLANFIRWTVDGVMYYTPIQYSDPGPQPTSPVNLQPAPTINPANGPESTSLITDYVSYETPAAISMNQYILDHATKTHQVAHNPNVQISAVHIPVPSPSGGVLANYRIRIAFKNYIWEIPAEQRLGGPIQPIHVTSGFNPNYIHSEGYHGTGTPNPDTACPGTITGTKPYHLIMEYWTGTTWANMEPTYPPNTDTYVPAYINGHGNIPINWSNSTGCVKVYSMPEGNNSTSIAKMRLSVFQDSTNTTTVVGELTIRMEEKDPGACFFFKSALDWQIPDFLVYDFKDEFYSAQMRRGYKWMTHWGVPLMERSKLWFKFIRWCVVQPFVWWGAWRYRDMNRWAWLLTPWCRAWLFLWHSIGRFAAEPPNPPGWRDKTLHVVKTVKKSAERP